MMIHAVCENGVFRPTEPVEIPEHSPVTLHAEVDYSIIEQDQKDDAAIWGILALLVDAGDRNLAERHA